MAGCSSIWVITEKKHIPILKSVVGIFVEDPVLAQLPLKFKGNYHARIPIMYASLPVRDVNRRDSYGRSILVGADYAIKIAKKISERAVPDKFYVSFPQTVYSPWRLQKDRRFIKSAEKNVYLTVDGKTIKDGIPVGFTFFKKDYDRYIADFKSMDVGAWEYTGNPVGPQDVKLLKRRPIEDRSPARRFTLDKIFRTAILDDAIFIDTVRSSDVSTWVGFANYMRSSYFFKMPKKVSYFRHRKIGSLEERFVDCGVFDDYDHITKDGESKD